MDSLGALVSKLQAYKPDWPLIAEYSGVPIGTVIRVARGYTKNPRIGTVLDIARGVEQLERKGRK